MFWVLSVPESGGGQGEAERGGAARPSEEEEPGRSVRVS